jgi:GntR family transcriptional regulator/MocR family aminotransferase
MDVHIRLSRRGELSVQIFRQLLEAVLDGRLRSGERLPPTRELAHRLEVSRNTVGVAYELLAAEGVLTGRVGSGSFISAEPLRRASTRRAPTGAVQPLEFWRAIAASAARRTSPSAVEYDFGIGTPDPALFPFATWRRLVAGQYRSSTAKFAWYGDPAGHAGLRAAIAKHIGVSRAVRTSADDVIVTQGAQQAFDLIGRLFIAEGMCVAVEEPGYPFVAMLFRSQGAQVVGVPVDQEGLDADAIPASARIVYVTPSHQFPLGRAMSLQRRTKLLAWAERRNAVIIEDDYDSEFRYGGRPLDPLQSLDRSGRVIYVGSFSKVLLPSLRLGFLVAPASLQPALRAAKQLTGWHGELATQAALARFIAQGLLARHIRKVSREYSQRYALIAHLLDKHFSRWLRLIPALSGLHLTAEALPSNQVDMEQVVRSAEQRGIRVQKLSDFYAAKPKSDGLVIGYGAIQSARIEEGMKRLAAGFGCRLTQSPE